MKNKLSLLLVTALIAAFVSGCALAKPEGAPQDRFAGFYLVASQGYDAHFYDNPNLTTAGERNLDLGKYGVHGVPRQVLYAGEDGSFPGLEGFPLYVLEVEEEYGAVTKIVSTMSEGDNQVNVSDGKTEHVLSGTVYMGPPEGAGADWSIYDSGMIWHALRVYQDDQGRAYLDGSGNSFNGGGTLSESYTQTVTVDGTEQSETIRVSVTVEDAPRLTEAVLLQYREDGSLLERQSLDLTQSPIEARWLPEASWAVAEERSPDQARRTVYSRPKAGEDPVIHTLILLDEGGIGRPTELRLK